MGRNFRELFRKPSSGRRTTQPVNGVEVPAEAAEPAYSISQSLEAAYENGRASGVAYGYADALNNTIRALENMPPRTGKQQILAVLKEQLDTHREDHGLVPHVMSEDNDG